MSDYSRTLRHRSSLRTSLPQRMHTTNKRYYGFFETVPCLTREKKSHESPLVSWLTHHLANLARPFAFSSLLAWLVSLMRNCLFLGSQHLLSFMVSILDGSACKLSFNKVALPFYYFTCLLAIGSTILSPCWFVFAIWEKVRIFVSQ